MHYLQCSLLLLLCHINGKLAEFIKEEHHYISILISTIFLSATQSTTHCMTTLTLSFCNGRCVHTNCQPAHHKQTHSHSHTDGSAFGSSFGVKYLAQGHLNMQTGGSMHFFLPSIKPDLILIHTLPSESGVHNDLLISSLLL